MSSGNGRMRSVMMMMTMAWFGWRRDVDKQVKDRMMRGR